MELPRKQLFVDGDPGGDFGHNRRLFISTGSARVDNLTIGRLLSRTCGETL